jgi:hypothetical protein
MTSPARLIKKTRERDIAYVPIQKTNLAHSHTVADADSLWWWWWWKHTRPNIITARPNNVTARPNTITACRCGHSHAIVWYKILSL